MLILTRKVGETFKIFPEENPSDYTEVKVDSIEGARVRLVFTLPKHIRVVRGELEVNKSVTRSVYHD